MTQLRARGVIIHQNRLFCVQLKHDDSYWCLPGGKVDGGEPIVDGLQRELFEELGIEPVIGRLLYIHQFSWHGNDNLEFFFEIVNAEAYHQVDLSKTSHGNLELISAEFKEPGTIQILPAFLSGALTAISNDTDTNWPKFITVTE